MPARKIEFFVTPDGKIIFVEVGGGMSEYTERNKELTEYILNLIEKQYPSAHKALCSLYNASKPNKQHYNYLRASRFIRCNFWRHDLLSYDIQDEIMHIEDVSCPIRCECAMNGIICKPNILGLTRREVEVARLTSSGRSYEEVSEELGITHSTIKNILQKIKCKLHLSSSREITKFFISTI